MILVCAIVQSEDADRLIARLLEQEFRLTRINSAGGFLSGGNVTILLGVDDDRFDDVVGTIGATCHARRRFINAVPYGVEGAMSALTVIAPMEVQVGGATVFGLPVKRLLRLQGGAAPPAADEHHAATGQEHARPANLPDLKGETQPMNLVLAIVHSHHVEAVTQALLAAGHRLTRISTAGGFLRRGNATLIIGAEEAQVDEILNLIQANCLLRTEANAVDAGIPMYGATVFVLETARFARV
jgi:uncharacterized protein YaaQ